MKIFAVAVLSFALGLYAYPRLVGHHPENVQTEQKQPSDGDSQVLRSPRTSITPSTNGDKPDGRPADENIAIQRESLALTRTYVRYTGWLVVVGALIGVLQCLLVLMQIAVIGTDNDRKWARVEKEDDEKARREFEHSAIGQALLSAWNRTTNRRKKKKPKD